MTCKFNFDGKKHLSGLVGDNLACGSGKLGVAEYFLTGISIPFSAGQHVAFHSLPAASNKRKIDRTYEGFVIWPDPKHAGDIALKADIKLGGFKKTPARSDLGGERLAAWIQEGVEARKACGQLLGWRRVLQAAHQEQQMREAC